MWAAVQWARRRQRREHPGFFGLPWQRTLTLASCRASARGPCSFCQQTHLVLLAGMLVAALLIA